jgi:hypothetical protein
MLYAEGSCGRVAAMKKTSDTPPTDSRDEEDPMWGDMLAGFFGVKPSAAPSVAGPARADKPAPRKPTRKLPKPKA